MKQKTLEEVAKECLMNNSLPTEGDFAEGYILGSIFGAKWQQIQDNKLYSYEDMKNFALEMKNEAITGLYNEQRSNMRIRLNKIISKLL